MMSDDELLAKAVEYLRKLESRRTVTPPRIQSLTVDSLPLRRVRSAIVIYFEREGSSARIQVFLDRKSGDTILANYIPEANHEATQTI